MRNYIPSIKKTICGGLVGLTLLASSCATRIPSQYYSNDGFRINKNGQIEVPKKYEGEFFAGGKINLEAEDLYSSYSPLLFQNHRGKALNLNGDPIPEILVSEKGTVLLRDGRLPNLKYLTLPRTPRHLNNYPGTIIDTNSDGTPDIFVPAN